MKNSNQTQPAPTNFSKLDENLRRAKEEIQAKQAELEQQQTMAKQLQSRLRALNNGVDQADEQLTLADEQFAQFTNQLASLRDVFLDAWGKEVAPPHYREVIALEAAIADFPRVRQHLVAKLAAAEAALQAFERQHLS